MKTVRKKSLAIFVHTRRIISFPISEAKRRLRRSSVLIRHGAPNKKVLLRLCNFSGETVRGFGLPPDSAWTATRYACPGRERREMKESNLKLIFVYVKYTFDILETSSRYDIIITVITKIDFKEIIL